MIRLGEVLLHALKDAGGKAVFGLPGDYALPFFEVMEKSSILPLFTLSHEPGIGFAADGAARFGGGIGIAAVTYGAGAMNMVNSVACAWAEHTPLVVISGAPGMNDMGHGLMLHHQIKTPDTQMNVFREFTCDQIRLDNPVEAPAQIERVLRSCLKYSRPVYIELPRDMVEVKCERVQADFSYWPPIPSAMVQECIDDIAGRLARASRPVVLAGSQVRRFGLEEQLFTLASGWSVPLLTSFMGKGLFAGKGWPHVGCYLGMAGDESLQKMVEESDFAMILGVIPCDTNWGVSGRRLNEKATLLATADSVMVGGRRYPGLTLRALVAEMAQLASWKKTQSSPPVVAPQSLPAPLPEGALAADDIAPIIHQALAGMAVKPPLVADVGDCLFAAMTLPGIPMLGSAYYATMGFAVPAAFGLQAACGQRPIVLVGDGGFQMTGWELVNCGRYGLDPVVIVINNSSWEMLRQFQPDSDYTRLSSVSYAALARDMGGEGITVRDRQAFAQALADALSTRGRFQLIELIIAPGDCTSTMKRYTSVIKANMQKPA